jgi:hypothetical protein
MTTELRLAPEGSSDVALIPNGEGSGVNLVADGDDDIFAGSDVNLAADGTGDLDFEGSDLSIASDSDFGRRREAREGGSRCRGDDRRRR